MSGTAAVVGVTNVSRGANGGGVGVGVVVTALVGEANGAVGLAGTFADFGDARVGSSSVGAAVAKAAIAGVADAPTVGDGMDAGFPAPLHPASMITTRSQQRKDNLWRLSIYRFIFRS